MGRDGVEEALGLTFTCGGIHPGRVEPASPMKLVSSGVGAFISFAAQAKHVQFESAGAAAFHTLPCGFNPGNARNRNLIGGVVLISPTFGGPFL